MNNTRSCYAHNYLPKATKLITIYKLYPTCKDVILLRYWLYKVHVYGRINGEMSFAPISLTSFDTKVKGKHDPKHVPIFFFYLV